MAVSSLDVKMNSNIDAKSNLDAYGFERPDNFDHKSYDEFMENYMTVLVRRAMKWDKVVKSNSANSKHSSKLKRYIRKGIPNKHRGMMWMVTSGAQKLKDENPDLYAKLLSANHNEDVVNTIKTDIPRTFPDNIYFCDKLKKQTDSLFNVLVAFSEKNPQVGYCQGLNFIAGMLLLITKSEETTFWLLVVLVESILPDYYTNNMMGLLTDLEVFAELVRIKVPLVYEHADRLGLAWPLISTKWFICLFAEVLPIETVLRIWDALFYEGSKILFRVGISILKINQLEFIRSPSFVDATTVVKAMTTNSHVLQCHTFMQAIFQLPGSLPMNQIHELRIKYRQKVIEEQNRTQRQRNT